VGTGAVRTPSCLSSRGNLLFSRDRSWEPHATPTGNVVPLRAHREAAATSGGRGRGSVASAKATFAARRDDDAPDSGAGPARGSRGASGRDADSSRPSRGVLREEELRAIETTYPDGLTAVQIVDAFTSRGIKLSEASFRKYVQQGLLPRSKRVGRKGKHKGSLGVYPAKTVRRINAVKQLMLDGYTVEEIQGQFLAYTDLLEGIAENLTELWNRLDKDHEQLEVSVRRELHKEMAECRRTGDALVERLGELTRRIAAPRTDTLRLAGAAGGAEDLL